MINTGELHLAERLKLFNPLEDINLNGDEVNMRHAV